MHCRVLCNHIEGNMDSDQSHLWSLVLSINRDFIQRLCFCQPSGWMMTAWEADVGKLVKLRSGFPPDSKARGIISATYPEVKVHTYYWSEYWESKYQRNNIAGKYVTILYEYMSNCVIIIIIIYFERLYYIVQSKIQVRKNNYYI